MVAPLGLSPCPPTHLHQGLVPLMFKEAHSLINEGPTSLVPVVGDDWWVLLCGNVGTWIFGQGLGVMLFPTGISQSSVKMVILRRPQSPC